MKSRLFILIRVMVTLAMLYLLVFPGSRRVARFFPIIDASALPAVLASLAPGFFLAALFFFALGVYLLAVRWRIILNRPGLSTRFIARLTLIGLFFNNFLPGAAGGDLVKGYYLLRGRDDKLNLGFSILVDRLMGAVSILSLGLVVVLVRFRHLAPELKYPIIFVFFALFVLLIPSFWPATDQAVSRLIGRFFGPAGRRIISAYQAFVFYTRNRRGFFWALTVSYASQASVIVTHVMVVRALGLELPLAHLVVAIPLVWCASLLPSLGGIGVRETAYVFFLREHLEREQAFALALTLLGLNIAAGIVGGVIHFSGGHRRTVVRTASAARGRMGADQ